MPIKHNASPDEQTSSYFRANEGICQSFDAFIVASGGETRGTYNAWSYNVLAKVRHPYKWEFRIKKATYTSGNLLLSLKYQSLHVASIWTARNMEVDCPAFHIRKRKSLDSLSVFLFGKYYWLSEHKSYLIKSRNPDHPLIQQLKVILKDLLETEKVWNIEFNNPVLSIEIRSENTHTKTIEKLLKMDV